MIDREFRIAAVATRANALLDGFWVYGRQSRDWPKTGLGDINVDLLEQDFLPAPPVVRLAHDFRFATVTGQTSGTSIVYLPHPHFMLRLSVFLASIFLSITVMLASQQVESGNSDGLILTQKP